VSIGKGQRSVFSERENSAIKETLIANLFGAASAFIENVAAPDVESPLESCRDDCTTAAAIVKDSTVRKVGKSVVHQEFVIVIDGHESRDILRSVINSPFSRERALSGVPAIE
jgi:hypothetical protein